MAYLSAINNAPHDARPEFGEDVTLWDKILSLVWNKMQVMHH